MIIQAKINGSESDSDEDKIDFDLSLQSEGPSKGLKIREGTQNCGGHNVPPWLR